VPAVCSSDPRRRRPALAIAFIQEFEIVNGDTSTTNYDSVVAKLGSGSIERLICHRRLRPRRERLPHLRRLGRRRGREELLRGHARADPRRDDGQRPEGNAAAARSDLRAPRRDPIAKPQNRPLRHRIAEAVDLHERCRGAAPPLPMTPLRVPGAPARARALAAQRFRHSLPIWRNRPSRPRRRRHRPRHRAPCIGAS
jgi:hypothetical protein